MIIPYEKLEPDTLVALIEDFVSRSDTCSSDETPMSVRVERVQVALRKGEAFIFFDPEMQQPILAPRREIPASVMKAHRSTLED